MAIISWKPSTNTSQDSKSNTFNVREPTLFARPPSQIFMNSGDWRTQAVNTFRADVLRRQCNSFEDGKAEPAPVDSDQ